MASINGDPIKRLDIPNPFFLSKKPFTNFDDSDYNWEQEDKITLLVKYPDKELEEDVKLFMAPEVSKENNLAIGGCPLECPFDPNENFDDALGICSMVPTFKALDYLGEPLDSLVFSGKTAKKLRKALYHHDDEILCDLKIEKLCGKDAYLRPIYISQLKQQSSTMVSCLLGYDDNRLNELVIEGPFQDPQELTVDHVLNKHCLIPSSSSSLGARIDVGTVHAVYEKIHGVYPSAGKVFIEFLWVNPDKIFAQPAPSALSKLAVKPVKGDANPFLKRLWGEIEVLENLLTQYESAVMLDLNKSQHSITLAEFNSEKVDELAKFLNHQSAPGSEKALDFSDSLESNLERVSNGDRTDVDFTDRLWKILGCSIQEICECFQTLFTNIESNLCRPYLFPSNKTIFSEILKKVSGRQVNYRTFLTPKVAVEMAIDCGINKLFKDYSFVLRMCHLSESSEIDYFCPNGDLRTSFEALKKLHCVLEVLCLCKERLGITMTIQEAQTRKLFQLLKLQKTVDWSKTYHFDITMNAIASVMHGMKPIYWNLKMESPVGLKHKTTNCIITKDFFVDHAKKRFSDDGVLRDGYYVYYHYSTKY